MKFLLPFFVSSTTAMAAVTSTYVFPSGLKIPDNSIIGLADSREVSAPPGPLQHLSVTLDITGGWNGDFYAHLVHDTGFAVLLNRIGRTGTMTSGSSSSGMLVNFDDQAGQDIHRSPPAGSITGSWQPDARTLDPGMVTNASPRSAFLTSFTGVDPNGQWTLFIADLSAGDVGTLNSWALSFTAVPELGACIPLVAAAAFIALGRTRLTFPVH